MKVITSFSVKRALPVMAGALIALVLLLNFLACASASHLTLHRDAGSVQHHCAVTLFASGQVETAMPPAQMPVPVFTFLELPERANTPWFSRFFDFSFTRGPPAILA